MKRLNRNVAVGVLRTLTALSGILATTCFTLFTESWNSLFVVSLLGITVVVLTDENIKALVR